MHVGFPPATTVACPDTVRLRRWRCLAEDHLPGPLPRRARLQLRQPAADPRIGGKIESSLPDQHEMRNVRDVCEGEGAGEPFLVAKAVLDHRQVAGELLARRLSGLRIAFRAPDLLDA